MSDENQEFNPDAADAADDDAEAAGSRTPPYRVKLEVFEGPLDLLLHLIKREEVEIVDIPIATITDQYLAHLDVMRNLNLDIAGEFLVMAATLMLIKSRLLLPPTEGEDDDEEEADPRADLVRQLLEYQRFREVARQLGERPLLRRDVFTREPSLDDLEPSADEGLPQIRASIWDLLTAFQAVLKRARPEAVHEIVTERISLRDRVQWLLQTLSIAKSIEFDSLFDEDATRLEIIVTFLAVLELMRMQAVQAVQEQLFDRIVITLRVADIRSVWLDLSDEYEGGVVAAEAAVTEAAAEEEVDDESHDG
jgi:segregation and condensation protein A